MTPMVFSTRPMRVLDMPGFLGNDVVTGVAWLSIRGPVFTWSLPDKNVTANRRWSEKG